MLSDALASGLGGYRIGPKIRALRLAKKLRLAELGGHTGLSTGLLSKIERGQLFPTLPTLLKIAIVFGVGLEHFFTDPAERPTVAVVRKKERVRLPDQLGDRPPSYFFSSLDFPATDRRMDAYYAEFEAPPTKPHSHLGAEIIYVLSGKLAVHLDSQDVVLSKGDSMYLDSSCPHSYQRQGRGMCAVVVVVAPGNAPSAPR
jgi:transcriptional regulator with XRE-family HTH domain